MKKLSVLIFLVMFSLYGCMTSGYGQFYTSFGGLNYPSTNYVELYEYSEKAYNDLLEKGYIVLGNSSFNGPMQNYNNAKNQGKKVGADIVLVKSKYKNTVQGSLSLPQYNAGQTTTVTTNNSGNVNVYGSGGYARGNYSGSSTSYITSPGYTTYRQIPYAVERYDQFAVFLRKKRNDQPKVEGAKEQKKERNPSQDKALQWYEKSYQNVMNQQWAEAIRTSSAAITINPNLTAAYVNRAWAYIEKGLFSEAIEDCNKAIEIENNNAAAFNNRGLAYSKLGEDKKAIMNYRKACEFGVDVACDNFKEKTGYLPSEEITFFQNQATESLSSNDLDQVISATGKVIGIDPKNAEAYSMRCEAKAYKGLVEEAKEDCKKSIEYNPDFSMAYNNLGYVLELEGIEVAATVYYEISCGMGNKMGCQNQQRLSLSSMQHGGSSEPQ